jgi:hypothetical protein
MKGTAVNLTSNDGNGRAKETGGTDKGRDLPEE